MSQLTGSSEADVCVLRDFSTMTVSLCIVVRNEAAFLGPCIESAAPVADEIVVVDTGSTDGTVEIARRAGARVFRHAWPGDLGRAHNLPLAHARCDWILSLDGDEVLDPHSRDSLGRLLRGSGGGCDGYSVAIRNYVYLPGEKLRTADPRDPHTRGAPYYAPTSVVRLFRRRAQYRFAGHLHQDVAPSIRAAGARIGVSNLTIHHYGFLRNDRFKGWLYYRLARRHVEEEPTSAQAWLEFGTTFGSQADLPFALEAFREARRHGELAASAYFIGGALSRMGHARPAVRYLQQALDSNRRDASPYFDRADALEQLGEAYEALERPRQAERAYRRALAARPASPVAMNNLAALYVERRAWREARVLLDRLLADCPGLDMPWVTLGLWRLGRGETAQARRAFETALEIHAENLPAIVNLAVCHQVEGRPRVAARAHAEAWELRDGWAAHELRLTSMLPPRPRRPPMQPLARGGVVSIISQLYGGAGRVAADIVLALRGRPHVVLCADPGSHNRQGLRRELEAAGAQVRAIGSAVGLAAALADLRPTAVIHHWWDEIVSEPYRVGDECWVAVGHAPLPMPVRYDLYAVLSEFHRSFQTHLPPLRLRYVPNGIDLGRFRRHAVRPNGPVTIAMLSRLDPSKFSRRLLALLPPLRALDARVLIAGRGARRYEIEPEIAGTPFEGCVRFVGGLAGAEVPDFLCGADIGLHLTETHLEVCPLAILEMLAAGLPIVAEPKGCLPELIVDGENGFLVEREEHVAARLTELVHDADLRRRMGRASRRMAGRYSMSRFAASWRRLLLGGAPRSQRIQGGSGGRSADRGRQRSGAAHSPTVARAHVRPAASLSDWRPRLCFLVCATPRSGSSLLCEALRNTGVAGRPQEFFNESMRLVMRESTTAEFAEYLAGVREDGSSPNGVFGAKILQAHLAALLERLQAVYGSVSGPAMLLERAFPGLRYIRIVRRDRLRQAMSFYRAMRSGRWVDDGHPAPRPRYDREAIERYRQELEAQERAWQAFFADNDIDPTPVVYEDLARDYEGTARAVLKHLRITPPRPMYLGERRLARQADALTERWMRRFLRESGAA